VVDGRIVPMMNTRKQSRFEGMKRSVLSVCFLILTNFMWAQPPSPSKRDRAVIHHVKNLLVTSLDRSLPQMSLEYFLKYEADGAPIQWEVNDCGEQSGNPAVDRGRDFPTCVQADMVLKERGAVTVLIAVGTFKRGRFGVPALFSLIIAEPGGTVRTVHRLSDLPIELHRPLSRLPKG
jgi:hypothetical protein